MLIFGVSTNTHDVSNTSYMCVLVLICHDMYITSWIFHLRLPIHAFSIQAIITTYSDVIHYHICSTNMCIGCNSPFLSIITSSNLVIKLQSAKDIVPYTVSNLYVVYFNPCYAECKCTLIHLPERCVYSVVMTLLLPFLLNPYNMLYSRKRKLQRTKYIRTTTVERIFTCMDVFCAQACTYHAIRIHHNEIPFLCRKMNPVVNKSHKKIYVVICVSTYKVL